MNRTFRLAAPLTLLLLSACGEKGNDAAQGSPGGEVLEGSISDAMLPLDTVRSQPPLAQQSGTASDKTNGRGGSSAPGGEASGDPETSAPQGEGTPAAAPPAPDATPAAE